MKVRLPKAIARAGASSRRHAETLIRQGRVTVNGQCVLDPGAQVDPERDHIKVNDRLLRPPPPMLYILMNKPRGVVTTLNDPEGRPTVADLLERVRVRLFPVGRLDYQTEGLLLLTNDGELAQRLLHPRYGIERAYLAKVKGIPGDADLSQIRKGIQLASGLKVRAQVRRHRVPKVNAWLEIVIREGRHREVRRLCEAIGHPVLTLRRTRFGPLTIQGIAVGQYRTLTEPEVRRLRSFVSCAPSARDRTGKEAEMT